MLKDDLSAVPEICLIAPSESLAALTKQVAKERGLNIGIYVAVLDEGLTLAKQLSDNGAKIFISRKGTAELLLQNNYTVAKINTTLNDYLRHLEILKGNKGKLVIVEHSGFIKELRLLCKYLGVEDMTILGYENAEDYEVCVEKAISIGSSCFMGGGSTLPLLAKRRGIPFTVVENTGESVNMALDSAIQLLEVQKAEQMKQKQYKVQLEKYITLVNYTHDAIISVDTNGIISIINEKVRSLLQLQNNIVGQHIQEIIPEIKLDNDKVPEKEINKIVKINGQLIAISQIPIIINQQLEGVLYLLQSVTKIQKSEREIRLQLHQKGLVAKYHFEDILGNSACIERVKLIARSYACADSAILLTGETGTGKELFAQSIHNSSARRNGPFVAINCAALPKDLLSSELFGYEEGSFTGAVKGGKAGIFESAHGGTIFLDEIGEIPEETQVQLLRILQEKEIRRLSSDKVIPVDVRVICATNKDLGMEVREKRFRMDLFYRINVLKLEIPPLRDRKEDIPIIAENYLVDFCDPSKLEIVNKRMDELYPGLLQYSWPGNIRELLGVAERIAILVEHGFPMEIDAAILMEDFDFKADTKPLNKDISYDKKNSDYRYEDILRELKKQNYHRQKTADALGISRSTLWRLIKKYDISLE